MKSLLNTVKEMVWQQHREQYINAVIHTRQTKPIVVLHSILGGSRLSDGMDKSTETYSHHQDDLQEDASYVREHPYTEETE